MLFLVGRGRAVNVFRAYLVANRDSLTAALVALFRRGRRKLVDLFARVGRGSQWVSLLVDDDRCCLVSQFTAGILR